MSFDTISPTGTILVVDDNPTNIQVLFDLLSEIGYRVAIDRKKICYRRFLSYKTSLSLS